MRDLAGGPGVVLLAGRFEGVDQRVIAGRGLREISIGDYVLSGGEIAAYVLIDAAVRLLPGVVGPPNRWRRRASSTACSSIRNTRGRASGRKWRSPKCCSRATMRALPNGAARRRKRSRASGAPNCGHLARVKISGCHLRAQLAQHPPDALHCVEQGTLGSSPVGAIDGIGSSLHAVVGRLHVLAEGRLGHASRGSKVASGGCREPRRQLLAMGQQLAQLPGGLGLPTRQRRRLGLGQHAGERVEPHCVGRSLGAAFCALAGRIPDFLATRCHVSNSQRTAAERARRAGGSFGAASPTVAGPAGCGVHQRPARHRRTSRCRSRRRAWLWRPGTLANPCHMVSIASAGRRGHQGMAGCQIRRQRASALLADAGSGPAQARVLSTTD